jgi:hypothetical protein
MWANPVQFSFRRAMPRIYGMDIKERPGRGEARSTLPASGEHGRWLRRQQPRRAVESFRRRLVYFIWRITADTLLLNGI